MDISKNNGYVLITNFKTLAERLVIMKLRVDKILITTEGEFEIDSSDNALLGVDEYLNFGVTGVKIKVNDFKRIEPLYIIADKIKESIAYNVMFFDYNDGVFCIAEENYSDGGSNKLYYFEDNDTFIFFDENGPNIKTESKTKTLLDILG